MEFRSKRLPSEDVIEADGQRCLAREEASLEQSPGKQAVNGRTDTQNRPKSSESKAGKSEAPGGREFKPQGLIIRQEKLVTLDD